MLKTTDGGSTWTSVPVNGAGGPHNFLKVRCANDTRCLLVPENSTGLVRTDNGGTNGAFISFGSTPINAAAFASANQAVAGASNGAMFTSTDGGNTWTQVGSSLGLQLTGLRAANASFAFAWGNLGADRDEPERRRDLDVEHDPELERRRQRVVRRRKQRVRARLRRHAVGHHQRRLHLGAQEHRRRPGAQRRGGDEQQRRAADRAPGASAGSTNGGGSFSSVSGKPVATARLAQADVVSNGVVAFGTEAAPVLGQRLVRGRRWTCPRRARRTSPIDSADCSSTKACWVLTTNGHLFRTTNAGKKWTDVTAAAGANDLSNDGTPLLSFDSSSSGYVATDGFSPVSSNLGSSLGSNGQGWVLATTDGGKSFAPQLIDANELAGLAAAGGTDFALADDQNLFLTSTNGAQGQASSLTLSASPKTIKKRTNVTLTARLSPCNGNEQILISGPGPGRRPLDPVDHRELHRPGAGAVSKTSSYVAQWAGEAGINGDGSKVLKVTKK